MAIGPTRGKEMTRRGLTCFGGVQFALTVSVAVIAACGSAHPDRPHHSSRAGSSRHGRGSTETGTTEAASSATSPGKPTSPASVGSAPGVARCTLRSLRPGEGDYVPESLNKEFAVRLINVSNHLCQTKGWPGVSFVDDAGNDLVDAARRGPAPKRQVLRPGGAVQVTIILPNPAGGNGCVGRLPRTSDYYLTPPGETGHLRLSLSTRQGFQTNVRGICHPAVYPVSTPAFVASAPFRVFRSPTGNIQCQLEFHDSGSTGASCQTVTPPRSVTLQPDGRTRICRGQRCIGNASENFVTLRYGRSVRLGPYRCSSSHSGIGCVVRSGRGFLISRQHIKRL